MMAEQPAGGDRGVYSLDAPDIAATEALGSQLARLLFPGAIIALIGPLGAGKTLLVRAMVAELGGDPRHVSSPTYALIHEYTARLPVYHFDTYRLPDETAFVTLGVDEYFAGEGVCLIEWADRVPNALPADHLRITIEPTGETNRRITLTACGERYENLLGRLAAESTTQLPAK
jgi:tRNA threonylcarbamoyladenosine biosynthesis protein TsaE